MGCLCSIDTFIFFKLIPVDSVLKQTVKQKEDRARPPKDGGLEIGPSVTVTFWTSVYTSWRVLDLILLLMWPIFAWTHKSICPVHFADQNWLMVFLGGTYMSVCNMRTKGTCDALLHEGQTDKIWDLKYEKTVFTQRQQEASHLSQYWFFCDCFSLKSQDQISVSWLRGERDSVVSPMCLPHFPPVPPEGHPKWHVWELF